MAGKSKGRKVLGYASFLRKDLMGFTDPRGIIKPLGVNKTDKSATFVITTTAQDREGDIMHPRGCFKRIDNYRRNPVVLYDHEGMPIGLCQSPAGSFGLRVEGDDLVGTCWFHCKTPLSREIWELVEAEPPILRMASVGFLPHEFRPLNEARVLRPDGRGGIRARAGNEYTDWELTEWSVVPIGMNQDALRHDLKKLSQVVRKSFSSCISAGSGTMPSMATLKTRYGKAAYSKRQAATHFKRQAGVDPAEWTIGETVRAYTFTKKDDKDKIEEEDGKEAQKKPEKNPDATNAEKPDKKEPKGDKPEETSEMKPGAQVLKDLHNHHQGLADYADTQTATNEHPGVLKIIKAHGEQARGMAEECKAAAAEHYPDLDFEKFCKTEQDEKPDRGDKIDEDEEDEALDDFEETPKKGTTSVGGILTAVTKGYHLKSAHKSCVKDASEFLGDMGQQEQIPKSYRGGCKFHAGELTKMLEGVDNPAREESKGEGEEDEDKLVEKALKAAILKIA